MSHLQALFDLIVRDAFAFVELREASIDFSEEHQALNRVVERCIRWQILEGLQDAVSARSHAEIVARFDPNT